MKQKTYRPILFLLISIPVMLALIGVSLYLVYKNCFCPDDDYFLWQIVFFVIIFLFGALFLTYEVVQILIRQRIILTDNEIFVPQNSFIKRDAYQFEVHIPYTEIADVACIYSTTTSKKTPDPARSRAPRKWAVFTMKDGKTRRFSFGYYTPRHSARILDDIISRCAEAGNALDVTNGADIVKSRFIEKSNQKSN